MNEKFGVTGIIFDEKGGARHFLLLQRVLNWRGWEFVKGGIEGDEKPEAAVLREISEETGLDNVKMVCALPEKFSWTAKDTKYIYTPFILRASMAEEIDIMQEIIEHDGFRWVLQAEVENMLTHEDNKRIFREALVILEGLRG